MGVGETNESARRSVFVIAADAALHFVPVIRVRMYGRDQRVRLTGHVIALRAKIWSRKARLQALDLRTGLLLFLAVLRYQFLCFKHFGRFRLAEFVLKMPEHGKAVFPALFTHDGNSK